MKAVRSDFLSDGSSDEELPALSLRERLARRHQRKSDPVYEGATSDNIDSVEDHIVDLTDNIQHGAISCASLPSDSTPLHVNSSDSNSVQIINNDNNSSLGIPVAMSVSGDKLPTAGCKKKRTREEIDENKRKAQEKKEAREQTKKIKDAEKEMKKIEREAKKQVSLSSCLQFITVQVDTNVVNLCGLGTAIFKACDELGARYQTLELTSPYTIMWTRSITGCNLADNMMVEAVSTSVEEDDVIAVIPVADFVSMVDTFKQVQCGQFGSGVTLRSYVEHLMSCLPGKIVTVIIPSLEQYFRDQKSKTKKQYREAVSSTKASHVARGEKRKCSVMVSVSRLDVEEACMELQLHTGSSIYMLDTPDEVADHVRRFTKAVAERPAKKDRFDQVFSFHEEGTGGVKVDRNGAGLLKVWKQQLLQFKNISPDVAQALIAQYPSPYLLRQAYQNCESEKEAIKLIENILVRRGAGVLETTRRIGKEQARRIYTFFTSDDPDLVIK